MKVIIFFQHVVRELAACKVLKKKLLSQLKETGSDVAIFSIDFEWLDACKWATKNGIDVVVMPWLHNDINYVLLHPFLEINPNVSIVNLHHEQIANPAYKMLQLPKGNYCKNGCFHFAWGPFFSQQLVSVGVRSDLIRVTGNMRLDTLVSNRETASKTLLAERFGLNPEKKWVMYAENRGWVYVYDDDMFSKISKMGVNREDITRNRKVCLDSLQATYHQISSLSQEFFDLYELIYRPHPGTNSPLTNDKCKIISDLPIGEWLSCVDCLVTWDSTSAYEAEVVGVPVFRHEPIPHPEDLMIYGLKEFPAISNLSELDISLGDYANLKDTNKVYEDYFGIVDGCATERVANEIINCATLGELLDSAYELDGIDKQRIRRKKQFEIVTKLFYKTKLLQIFKWPRSAAIQFNDIPY